MMAMLNKGTMNLHQSWKRGHHDILLSHAQISYILTYLPEQVLWVGSSCMEAEAIVPRLTRVHEAER
jgi:hypothetical protein